MRDGRTLVVVATVLGLTALALLAFAMHARLSASDEEQRGAYEETLAQDDAGNEAQVGEALPADGAAAAGTDGSSQMTYEMDGYTVTLPEYWRGRVETAVNDAGVLEVRIPGSQSRFAWVGGGAGGDTLRVDTSVPGVPIGAVALYYRLISTTHAAVEDPEVVDLLTGGQLSFYGVVDDSANDVCKAWLKDNLIVTPHEDVATVAEDYPMTWEMASYTVTLPEYWRGKVRVEARPGGGAAEDYNGRWEMWGLEDFEVPTNESGQQLCDYDVLDVWSLDKSQYVLTMVVNPVLLDDTRTFLINGVTVGFTGYVKAHGLDVAVDLLTGGQCSVADDEQTILDTAEEWVKSNLQITRTGYYVAAQAAAEENTGADDYPMTWEMASYTVTLPEYWRGRVEVEAMPGGGITGPYEQMADSIQQSDYGFPTNGTGERLYDYDLLCVN